MKVSDVQTEVTKMNNNLKDGKDKIQNNEPDNI